MASITNRSAFTVTVPGQRGPKKYTRTFVHGKLKDAEAYMRALIEHGLTPDITQAEDSSVFISRSYCCRRNMPRPRQRWTSGWLSGLGWSGIWPVFRGGGTCSGERLASPAHNFGEPEILADSATGSRMFLIYRNSS
jgi:hypothetical protein